VRQRVFSPSDLAIKEGKNEMGTFAFPSLPRSIPWRKEGLGEVSAGEGFRQQKKRPEGLFFIK